jgi:hypothetical protein
MIGPLSALVLSLGFAGIASGEANGLRDAAKPWDVGNRRQVFIDGRFLAESHQVELHVHQPIKTREPTIKPEYPWEQGGVGPYSCVLKENKTYHMWYHVMSSVQWHIDKYAGCICYARSEDGIHWEKPHLGIVAYEGDRKNNIVFGHGAAGVKFGQDGGMVFIDPTAPADQKFRLVMNLKEAGEGIHVFSSPDGIHWRLTHPSVLTARTQEHGHHLDSQNVIFYDDRLKKYVAYGRKNLGRDGSAGRSVFRAEADDLTGFPVVQDMPVALGPDPLDMFHGETAVVDYYLSAAVKYPWAQDAYYMFPTTYYHYIPGTLREFTKEVPTNAGPLHTQFAASRDGIRWERYDRRPFVDLGMKGEFDWASSRMIYGIVPDVEGREMYMYYRASDWLHGWDRDERNKRILTEAGLGASQNIAVISRVVLRRDGFVSVRAAYTGGEFVTPLIKFKGSKLALNVDTSATGIVRVGIINKDGQPIDGYRVPHCDRIHTANEANRVVTWRGNADVSQFAGQPIRLRFVMRDADLYAFEFQD